MPHRWASVALLIYWGAALLGLLTRDLIPEFSLGKPPDLRSISRAEEGSPPSQWAVQVVDDPNAPEVRRTVGQAFTESARGPDGLLRLKSRVWFDSGGLLRGTPFADRSGLVVEIDGVIVIDISGNLLSFHAGVKSRDEPGELVSVDGRRKGRAVEVRAKGPLPVMNQSYTLPYEPHDVVQNSLGPIDRLPGLQIGQRWDTRVVSPLTGKVETVRVEVARRGVIQWADNPVSTLEVVQHMTPFTVKAWVRPDGLVLRQEIPFPFVKLVLDRVPDTNRPLIPKVFAR